MSDPRSIHFCAMVLALVLAIGVLCYACLGRMRRQIAAGYGPGAYLGPPASATLDVDLLGDPRYGGVTPEVITLAELRTRGTYTVTNVDWLGAPDRVDYWDGDGSARLVWRRSNGALTLLMLPVHDTQTLQMWRSLPSRQAGVPGCTVWNVQGVSCVLFSGGPYGAPAELSILHPDGSVSLVFQGGSLSLPEARELAKQLVSQMAPDDDHGKADQP